MKTLRSAAIWVALVMPMTGASQNAAAPETGTIRGAITRASNGEAVSGATVTLQGGAVDPQAIQALLSNAAAQGVVVTPAPGATPSEIVQAVASAAQTRGMQLTVANIQSQLTALSGRTAPTTTTDRDGQYTFASVAPGTYTIRVQKDGYFGKPEAGTYPPTAALSVSVAAKETKEASLSLIPGALIGGRVFDANGQLLSNAIVNALRVTYPLGNAVLSGQTNKSTDDRGEFRLFWVPPGDYYLTAEAPRAAPTPGAGPAGQGNKTFYPGVADVTESRIVSIKGGEEILGMDIGIRIASSFKVSGQVSSLIPPPAAQAATPAVNAAVLVLLSPNAGVPDDTKQVGTVPLVPTTGRFEVPNILPGTYDLFARVPDPAAQAAGGAPQAWGRARVQVRDADVNNVAVLITPSVEVKGSVTAADGRIPASLRIQLLPDEASASKIPAYQQVSSRSVPVSPGGTFSVPAVPEGRFRVGSVAGLPQGMYLADVREGAQSVFDSGFDVNAKTGSLEVVLGSGSGTVNGVVQDGPTKVVSAATVVLVPEAQRRSNRALYFVTNSDASGRFTLRGVAPGDYKIFAWESIPAFAHVNAAFLAKHEDRGKPVYVGQGGTVSAELTVIPAVAR